MSEQERYYAAEHERRVIEAQKYAPKDPRELKRRHSATTKPQKP